MSTSGSSSSSFLDRKRGRESTTRTIEIKSPTLPQISVHNRQRKIPVERAALEQFARRALPFCAHQRGPGLTNLERVDVLLISDRRISELHRRFLQIAGPTDVITFQHGEIFLSVETAQRQAKTHRTSLVHELRLYLVHGLLHLRGLDDRKPAARARMQAAQEKIMGLVVNSKNPNPKTQTPKKLQAPNPKARGQHP